MRSPAAWRAGFRVGVVLALAGCATLPGGSPSLRAIRLQYPAPEWLVGVGEAPASAVDAPTVARMKAEAALARQAGIRLAEHMRDESWDGPDGRRESFGRSATSEADGRLAGIRVADEGRRHGKYRVVLVVPRTGVTPRAESWPNRGSRTPNRSSWQEVEITTAVPAGETSGAARTDALIRARAEAVRRGAGLRIHGSHATAGDELVSAQAVESAGGRILEERIIGDGPVTAQGGQPGWRIRLRARVIPIEPAGELVRVRARIDRPVYAAGDEPRISIEVSRPAHIYVIGTGDGNGASLLYPSRWDADRVVDPGRELVIPTATAIASGARLRVALPAGAVRVGECLRVLASLAPLRNAREPIENSALAAELADGIDASRGEAGWDETTVAYEIVAAGRP